MTIVSADIGAKNTYLIPSEQKEAASGMEKFWREKTPNRRVAFGPKMTRARLAGLLKDHGTLTWLPATLADADVPPNTHPLFIVEADGRGYVVNQATIQRVRRRHRNRGAKVLCIASAVPDGG